MAGLVEAKVPVHVTTLNGPGGFVFYVFYTDGTSVEYGTIQEDMPDSLVAVDCPGQLNFVRTYAPGMTDGPPGFIPYSYYYYTYTEAGVTTEEFRFEP